MGVRLCYQVRTTFVTVFHCFHQQEPKGHRIAVMVPQQVDQGPLGPQKTGIRQGLEEDQSWSVAFDIDHLPDERQNDGVFEQLVQTFGAI